MEVRVGPHLLHCLRQGLLFSSTYPKLAVLQVSRDSYFCIPSLHKRAEIVDVPYSTPHYVVFGDLKSDLTAC